ncbi:HFR131Wp [Eremothecium sinecaudum]|uniref:HFR131Wp n=1 Tax=Eremothecium sinecaudum TaxID=45286 RepID=A0A0X8HUF2_9SACH|nr:HFR131Wp [Eremothecium sinecaudum]AMD21986.1 HFR131Wp [Eremothecium sinecaudum]
MGTVGVILNRLHGTECKDELRSVVERCLPYLGSNEGVLDIILLDPFKSSELLESTLVKLYNIIRQVLLKKDFYAAGINVIFNRPLDKLTSLKWDVIFLSDPTLMEIFQCEKKELFILPPSSSEDKDLRHDAERYSVCALGGTFDHLHDGHKILLSMSTFLTSSKLIVGVTDQPLLRNKKYPELLESYDKRCEKVIEFLNRLKDSLQIKLFPLHDTCGPTGTEPDIEALVVSRETVSGGEFINKTRNERHLPLLDLYVVNVLGGDESNGWREKLSSTEIRRRLLYN